MPKQQYTGDTSKLKEARQDRYAAGFSLYAEQAEILSGIQRAIQYEPKTPEYNEENVRMAKEFLAELSTILKRSNTDLARQLESFRQSALDLSTLE
ncbi:MAG: hypothetical protein Q8P81_03960 [Nanoarchaeota archaeon]|nr:hypothetical protein [Nanoarchaeota archaeon]